MHKQLHRNSVLPSSPIVFLGPVHPLNSRLPQVLEICYWCETVTDDGMSASSGATSLVNEVRGGEYWYQEMIVFDPAPVVFEQLPVTHGQIDILRVDTFQYDADLGSFMTFSGFPVLISFYFQFFFVDFMFSYV